MKKRGGGVYRQDNYCEKTFDTAWIRVLERFSMKEEYLSVSQVREKGMPVSATHQMVNYLCSRGLLEEMQKKGTYLKAVRITPRGKLVLEQVLRMRNLLWGRTDE